MTFDEAFDKLCKKENINRYGDYAADIIDNCRRSYKSGAASRDAEVAELKQLLVLIFESTHPYRDDGTCTFSDSVTDKWKELMP